MKTLFATASCLVALGCAGCASGPETAPEPAEPAASPPAAPSPPPVPPDPAPQTDGDVTVGWVHGMQVLVKRVPGADFVAGQLFIRGGVRNWNVQTAGIEQLALTAAVNGGTRTVGKDRFVTRLAELGSTLTANSGSDYGLLSIKALKANWDETFAMMVDAFLHPAMPAAEVELSRARQLAGIKHELEFPDAQLQKIATEALFKGHPYENRPIGTADNVKGFTGAQLEAHLGKLRETHRLLWVVVGDVDPARVLEQARAALGVLPPGDYAGAPLPPVGFEKAKLTAVPRPLPTQYVESFYLGPKDASPESAAAVVANEVLNWRVFEEVRTKRNLSYAPHASYNIFTEVPRGALYVTAVSPNETMKVMLDEAKRLQTEPVADKDLAGAKSVFITELLAGNQTMDGQARFLGAAQLYWGDWRVERNFPEMIRGVTAAQVQDAAKKNIARLQTVTIGPAEHLDEALLTSM